LVRLDRTGAHTELLDTYMNWILAALPPPVDALAPALDEALALASPPDDPPPPDELPPLEEPQAAVSAASPTTAHAAAALNR
jgi:hypothetical protein